MLLLFFFLLKIFLFRLSLAPGVPTTSPPPLQRAYTAYSLTSSSTVCVSCY
jgi:hypothetical protein